MAGMNAEQLVLNVMTTRAKLLEDLLDGDHHDINTECGYPTQDITVDQFRSMYDREGFASRVVEIFPEESWAEDPEVYETEDSKDTEWEKQWKALVKRHNIWHYLQRVDVLSGIGHFGILYLGFNDIGPNETPAMPVKTYRSLEDRKKGKQDKSSSTSAAAPKLDLLYIRAFDESLVQIASWETDTSSPRYGQPTAYNITFADPRVMYGATGQGLERTQLTVHWTRVIHIADNRMSSEVFGVPRMQRVYNRLYDLRKILSGSGEMFWKGAFPGYALETSPDMQDVEIDEEAIAEKFLRYSKGLQRWLGLLGMSIKSLAPQVADPTAHIKAQLQIIALATGVPWRVFMGSEEAKLAADADSKSWQRRLRKRQDKYICPWVIRPFVDRLMEVGVLPFLEEYFAEFPDISAPSDLEKAEIAEKIVGVMAKYIQGGVDQLVPPMEFLTLILDFTEEEASAILKSAIDRVRQEESDSADPLQMKAAKEAEEKAAQLEAMRQQQGQGKNPGQTPPQAQEGKE